MKVGGRSRDDDEEVPVVLVEDGVPRVTTTEVELDRPRRPRRELLLVVLAVAVVAGVGLVGGGDGTGDPQDAATPPTTARRGPRTESVAEYRATSTTTRPRPPRATTTSTIELLAGRGPMLPTRSGTTLGLLDHSGGVTILDVDTGNRCRTVPSRGGVWMPWSSGIELPLMVVQANTTLMTIDRACAATDVRGDTSMGWPAAITGGTVWMVDHHDQGSIAEVDLRTGERTGRSIELPAYAGVQAAGDADGLVLGVSGSMTYVDLERDERRDLGAGMPIGLRDGMLVYSSCPALECHVATLDLATGARRAIEGIGNVTPWDTATFSTDGHHARVSIANQSGEATGTVIDLRTGSVVLRTELVGGVFSADGRWLIGLQRGNVVAVALDGDTSLELDIGPRAIQGLTVIASP